MFSTCNWIYEYRIRPISNEQWTVEYRYTTRFLWFRTYKSDWYKDNQTWGKFFKEESAALAWAKHRKAWRQNKQDEEFKEEQAKKAFRKANPPRLV